MALNPGTRLGPYEILEPLGVGGMGEVYRARDTRLEREVAVKVLPRHLSSSEGMRQRFEREAKAISQLSHPHICALYDVGSHGGTEYLVMEYLEGETLAARLVKGPLLLEQTLRFGVEIADALDKAHRQGIVHRDLKPGNVMLTKSGVKLLDFGLAKAMAPTTKQSSLTALPTQQGLTQEGTILGTFQYMAPEQLEGKEADGRTDIFAFGAVLYEMATGKKAFTGSSQASLISAILRDDPQPISQVQPMTPPVLDRVVKRCLAKDPEERWQSAGDLKSELKWIAEGSQAGVLAPVVARRKSRERIAWAVAALGLIAALGAGLFAWQRHRSIYGSQTRTMRFGLAMPVSETLALGDLAGGEGRPSIALSPDGSTLVYVVWRGGRTQLYSRFMNRMQGTPIAGTEDGTGPFFSQDGQSVGFFANRKLKKVSLSGGAPVTVCDAPFARGGSWGSDDTIIFAPWLYSGLSRIPASGSHTQLLTTLDEKKGERNHRWPEILPGGRAVLFTIGSGTSFDEARIVLQRLDSGERRVLIEGGTNPRYVPTGHLVYGRAGSLLAVPFDLPTLKVTGPPRQVLEDVRIEGSGAVQVSFSQAGTLFYVSGGVEGSGARMIWVDRNGTARPSTLPGQVNSAAQPRISPDGRRVVFMVGFDVWVFDLARGTSSRLTSGTRTNSPIWSPSGQRVAFASEKRGPWNLFWKAADGSGEEEQLLSSSLAQIPRCFTPDGKALIFTEWNPRTGSDIWILSLGDHKARPFVQTSFSENDPMISPDGRWLAYTSDESGRNEVYVVPYPAAPGKWPISTQGGDHPVWARNGRELFYITGEKMMSVAIATEPAFTAGAPRLLFEGRYTQGFDVSLDGQTFAMLQMTAEQAAPQLNAVVNWFEDLTHHGRPGERP